MGVASCYAWGGGGGGGCYQNHTTIPSYKCSQQMKLQYLFADLRLCSGQQQTSLLPIHNRELTHFVRTLGTCLVCIIMADANKLPLDLQFSEFPQATCNPSYCKVVLVPSSYLQSFVL